MSDHDPTDPICPSNEVPDSGCLCAWLSAARADERERIAQAIEALGSNMPKGARTHDYYVGLHDAAQIARNGERDE